MDSKVKDNGQAKVANTVQADKTPKFVAGNPVNPEAKAQEQKSEPSKLQIKTQIAQTISNQKAILERTIKLGDDLARKIRHRDNLQTIITTLTEFEVELKDDVDETDGNHFQGCVLTIKDDKGGSFTTKNPVIIKHVAEEVNTLCQAKLEEVETGIISLIPAEI
ncbi:hypothetical protein [Pedobacter sp. GR22-6]|uniref:hypothetical protein n=1 Tax=Pedobacter sp. GR22-6 TaxID=3127957 RepID=UPI00307F12F5